MLEMEEEMKERMMVEFEAKVKEKWWRMEEERPAKGESSWLHFCCCALWFVHRKEKGRKEK